MNINDLDQEIGNIINILGMEFESLNFWQLRDLRERLQNWYDLGYGEGYQFGLKENT